MQLNTRLLKNFLDDSLLEDYGTKGDITSMAIINPNTSISFSINTREDAVICGTQIAEYFFNNYANNVQYELIAHDGNMLNAGSAIIEGKGNAQEILMLERIILNYLQFLSGVSTMTARYVREVQGTGARILDTRKTIPGLRTLQKYAVECGGGYNHRLTLDSSILIKDNHIAICGSIREAIERAKKYSPHYAKIEIECDTIKQVQEALKCGVDVIMLDNMSLPEIQKAVSVINKKALVEVSGGVNLTTVRNIAQAGVDIISIGKLTHSATAIDIGMDII